MKSTMKSATPRRLLLLVVASCFLLFAHASNAQLLEGRNPQLQVRQVLSGPQSVGATTTTPASTPPTTATTPTTTPPHTTSTTPTTTPTTPTTTPQTTATTPSTTQSIASPTTTSQPSSSPPVATLPQVTTNSFGQTITSFVEVTASSTSAAASSTQSSSSNTSSGLGTGSIIGLSVAGGVAVIAIVSFFVWKFTRKRFADFDDSAFSYLICDVS